MPYMLEFFKIYAQVNYLRSVQRATSPQPILQPIAIQQTSTNEATCYLPSAMCQVAAAQPIAVVPITCKWRILRIIACMMHALHFQSSIFQFSSTMQSESNIQPSSFLFQSPPYSIPCTTIYTSILLTLNSRKHFYTYFIINTHFSA